MGQVRWAPESRGCFREIARAPLLVFSCAAAALVVCFRSERECGRTSARYGRRCRRERTDVVARMGGPSREWNDWTGNLDLADRDVARALELDPGYAPAHVTRAYDLLAHGDVEGARREIAHGLDRLGQGQQLSSLARARFCASGALPDAPACIRAKR